MHTCILMIKVACKLIDLLGEHKSLQLVVQHLHHGSLSVILKVVPSRRRARRS